MKKFPAFLWLFSLFLYAIPHSLHSQVNQDKVGAWYMYFWNTTLGESSWGFQGDIQHRNWNAIGDLEQLLLRGGVTYTPENAAIKFTFGYGHIQTGAYGTDDTSKTYENRIYQEALIPHKIGNRFYLTHRFRYEQRFVEDQDFRTRYRYNIFLNVPLNQPEIDKNALYIALYNELFINGESNIGNGNTVEVFDRNRSYAAMGYAISKKLKVQLGIMHQITDAWEKSQLQVSLHHTF